MFEIIPALGVLSVAVSGFEADDIIATLSTRFKADMDEIVIVTQDKDILQLKTLDNLLRRCLCYLPLKKEKMKNETIRERE
ncbi:MAG: hypothetical protein KKI20_06105 [Gammaproteobacteria bacterium]|nr:hypothetical protein [Gammaproteobacteria bacterium]